MVSFSKCQGSVREGALFPASWAMQPLRFSEMGNATSGGFGSFSRHAVDIGATEYHP